MDNNINPPTLAEIEEALRLKNALKEPNVLPDLTTQTKNTSTAPEVPKIEDLVREFEAKANIEEAKKAPVVANTSDAPNMVRFVIKLSGGTLKEKYAEYVLLGFVITIMGVSIYLLFGSSRNITPQKSSDLLIKQIESMSKPATRQ